LKDGQQVLLHTTRSLSSAKEKDGNEVEFEVTSSVRVGDLTVIPAHAPAFGKITKVQHKRRAGKPGTLQITIQRVRLVDGQWAQLRAVKQEAGQSGSELADNIGSASAATIVGLPVGFVALLLTHGKELTLPEGYDITAFVNGDVLLDRAAVLKAQGQPEVSKPADGTVFVYWFSEDGMPGAEHVTCGDVEIGVVHPGQFLRLDIPPGRYWFRTVGVKVRREARSLRPEYKTINVESSKSYFLRFVYAGYGTKLQRMLLSEVDGSTAEPKLHRMNPSAGRRVGLYWVEENMSKLQTEPGDQNPPLLKQSAPSSPESSDQRGR